MEKKPYHHLSDGTFINPQGSPERTSGVKWDWKTFSKEKKKLNMTVPKEHVVDKEKVLSDLEKYKNEDYIAWFFLKMLDPFFWDLKDILSRL